VSHGEEVIGRYVREKNLVTRQQKS
jgi:hypothetical protein